MKRMIALALLACLALVGAGCSSIETKRYGNVDLNRLKIAFVVRDPNASHYIENYIQETLTQRGVSSRIGVMEEKPKDAAFYVQYQDRWKWDMAMYLHSLDIHFKDNGTGELLASGAFRQGWFHSFPDPKKKTFEIIEKIYLPAANR